ncbi:hypothetical protein BN946_scf185037.g3 [Trametes cinnabarina]|uniref:BRCT domain-containing protein n=1 Tax=Pycnoporus cinnabarinus TaxID=5643 RepID=A0A060SP66_PYCCI|nr:hypothetical protein BN946_scf185037.g3 [Trametes cinnabarina]
MGTPLAIYVEKDVDNREEIVELIHKHGGMVSPSYSGVSYILVDPHKDSGQSLYRLYANKKGKIVLDAQWVIRCVEARALQTYHTNFGGCKVTGTEKVSTVTQSGQPRSEAAPSAQPVSQPTQGIVHHPRAPEQAIHRQPQGQQLQQPQHAIQPAQPQQPPQSQPPPATHTHSSPNQGHPIPPPPPGMPMAHPAHIVTHQAPFPYPVYENPMEVPPRAMQPPTAGPPQTWQAANGIAPSQTHIAPPPPPPPPPQDPQDHPMMDRHPGYGEEHPPWNDAYHHMQPPPPGMVPPPPPEYAYRYREDQTGWVPESYYPQQHYEHQYPEPQAQYMEEAGPSNVHEEATAAEGRAEKPRGRRRTKTQPQPAPPASTLVANRRNPQARSPTPPKRVIKSTYGGNLFTADDIDYLKRYIDYCQEQGLVLSLREICERVAIKVSIMFSEGGSLCSADPHLQAPHHTFYSWRRYCNKHKIRLGGYAMDLGDDEDQGPPEPSENEAGPSGHGEAPPPVAHGPGAIVAAHRAVAADIHRTRSPTPPRALYRSTTGKGVAFTDEDVIFLVRFLEYRSRQHEGKLDMVTFWKEVAAKAPHHSRASWMKFYRRHKHELHHTPGDEPLPAPPEKKMRYSRQDDVLLAKYFINKPEGTSDKIFQTFARQYPHHPWKGWQEHHRIHKVKIDYLIQRLAAGENIDEAMYVNEIRTKEPAPYRGLHRDGLPGQLRVRSLPFGLSSRSDELEGLTSKAHKDPIAMSEHCKWFRPLGSFSFTDVMGPSQRFRLSILIKPKEGLSLQNFLSYWEHEHAALFTSIAIAKRNLRKYEQFHVDEASTALIAQAWRATSTPVPSYAGVATLEADTLENILDIFKDEEFLRVVAPDEDKFVDRSSLRILAGHYVTVFET